MVCEGGLLTISPDPRGLWGTGRCREQQQQQGQQGQGWESLVMGNGPSVAPSVGQTPPRPPPCPDPLPSIFFSLLLHSLGKAQYPQSLSFKRFPLSLSVPCLARGLSPQTVLVPQASTFMLSAQLREAGCLGPQTAAAHSYVLGLSPQT